MTRSPTWPPALPSALSSALPSALPILSRRRLLRAALATGGGALTAPLLAACSSGRARPTIRPPSSPRPSPVVNSAPTAAIAGEARLLAAYGAVLQRHPELADVLAVPLAHHRIHAQALGLPTLPTPGTPGPPVSTDAREALRTLLVLERQSADSRGADAVSDLVNGPLLAAIGAADAVHADLLAAALPLVAAPAPAGGVPRAVPTTPSARVAPTQPTAAPIPAPIRTPSPVPTASASGHPPSSHPPSSKPPPPSSPARTSPPPTPTSAPKSR